MEFCIGTMVTDPGQVECVTSATGFKGNNSLKRAVALLTVPGFRVNKKHRSVNML